jgi:hypothetical protein
MNQTATLLFAYFAILLCVIVAIVGGVFYTKRNPAPPPKRIEPKMESLWSESQMGPL